MENSNRVLKFRAWSNSKKIWSEVFDLHHIPVAVLCKGIGFEDLEIVQFTGLKDRNGRGIFEGDIVKTEGFDDECIAEVIFKNGMFVDKFYSHAIGERVDYQLEVIGNVYENPELLEEKPK